MPKKAAKAIYFYGIGRRKSAIASIRLFLGKASPVGRQGGLIVNGKPIEEYFPGKENEVIYKRPFELVEAWGRYSGVIRTSGGGKEGQLQAICLAVSRALKKVDKDFSPILRRAGLLTIDARVRERRKVGQGGRARRKKQSPKR